ncbi:glycosyltransferase family 1 protein [Streptococcus equinus]|uniref:glycosyltransferase family 1 protein n=1 Tax=Streptococcus equinus TaxID=1335 RepID=UPI00215B527B|nr:glycosyltransferase family 1 protein [Streptococcus equinus]UVF03446.1 glycosyltransferase family 1 protein [Streptococcus equinus]
MTKDKPIRVAHIIGKWVGGGVESVVMNYYRHIDRSKIQFDFICDSDSTNIPYEEIKKLGGNVILVSPYQKVFKYHRELKKVLKEGQYQIVHSHINTLSVFSLCAAKRAGVPVRIAHSHSTSNKKEYLKNMLKFILKPFSKLFATNYMACTEHAGRWLFGDKEFDSGNVFILNNAIDVEKFKYNEEVRIYKRKALTIAEDSFVIGHIGRFVEQKNHHFLIDVFNEFHNKYSNSVLLLIGQGPLMREIKEKVNLLGLQEAVQFLGQRDDVSELYQAFDLFLFPSLYEGLGMVMIEAQCSGLPCVASSEVPMESKINNNVYYLSLQKNVDMWVNVLEKNILKKRYTNLQSIKNLGFEINLEAQKLAKEYLRNIFEQN